MAAAQGSHDKSARLLKAGDVKEGLRTLSGSNKGEGESGEAGKHGEYGFGRCWILYDAIYVRNVKRTRTKCAGRNVRTWLCTPPSGAQHGCTGHELVSRKEGIHTYIHRSWHIRCLRRWG